MFSGTHKYWKIFHTHSIFLSICPGSSTLQPREYVGKAKGFKHVLFERGLFRDGMTKDGTNGNCDDATSMQFVLSECIDFKLQKTAIAELLEQRGHLCDFLPKYHPELSPIERCWAVSKRYSRTRGKFNYADMIRKLKISLLDQAVQPVKMIRNVF